MTSTETDAGPALSDEELARFPEAIAKLRTDQPTFALLDPTDASWVGEIGSGQHLMTFAPDVTGVLDLNVPLFLPNDPEQLRALLIGRLTELYGSGPLDVDGASADVDWQTTQVVSEISGVLQLSASGTKAGVQYPVSLALDADLAVLTLVADPPDDLPAEAEAEAAAETAEAEAAPAITGDYLNQYYAGVELQHDGSAYRLDWTAWQTDQVTPDGQSGSWLTGTTAAGGSYQAYVLFDPNVGPRLTEVRVLREPATPQETAQPSAAAITAAYLAQYYTGAEFEHDGRRYLIDWQGWETNQTTPEGLSGSWANATTSAGGGYRLYVWFDPAKGPVIAQAEELTPPAEVDAVETVAAARPQGDDPAAVFDAEIVPMLRDYWRGMNNTFSSADGREYDVTGFVEQEFDFPLQFTGFDGTWHARLVARAGEGQKVACELRIADRDTIYVDLEENAY